MAAMKSMSLEELMDIEVTTVSRRPERLSEAASAIQIITREDILRSGATSIPEALRLASNLQVARLNAREWAVSARGFNATFANKLLVLIDGRTVYTPLYSGVFWDAQHVLLEDVDRIEVVSGPGGALWGSNAVNGVINIVTREAALTQGLYLAGGVGNVERGSVAGRSGGRVDGTLAYRVYGQHSDDDGTVDKDGKDLKNPFGLTQGGLRMDWHPGPKDDVTAQADMYQSRYDTRGPGETQLTGQDALARWTRTFSGTSDLQVQAYFDRTWRKAVFTPDVAFTDDMKTYDLDLHHRFALGSRQTLLWGGGYRLVQDEVENFQPFSFLPTRKDLPLFNAYVADEVHLLGRRVKVSLGSKFENEAYSGWNAQPSLRAAWTPNERQTLWAAVSRAVRSPSRIDKEFFAPSPPYATPTLHYAGGAGFGSESLMAYELGYRAQPLEALALSVASFYQRYYGLRSLEFADPATLSLDFRNGLDADERGVELSGELQPIRRLKVRGGYTYLEKDVWNRHGHQDLTVPHGQWNDPSHQANAQAMADLPFGFELDLTGYYVSSLPDPFVQSRLDYAAGLVWRHGAFELSLWGRDLADDHDPEYGSGPQREEIPRSVSARAAMRI